MFIRSISLLLCIWLQLLAARAEEAIEWHPWSEAVFEQAKKENRFVLLDLGAVWCHWCHVMEEITYRDPEVVRLIRSRYIAVQVDQDSRPDLSNRYEDYGWPATIVFDANGGEIVKRQGYIPWPPCSKLSSTIQHRVPPLFLKNRSFLQATPLCLPKPSGRFGHASSTHTIRRTSAGDLSISSWTGMSLSIA
jgi:hypothetical protein